MKTICKNVLPFWRVLLAKVNVDEIGGLVMGNVQGSIFCAVKLEQESETLMFYEITNKVDFTVRIAVMKADRDMAYPYEYYHHDARAWVSTATFDGRGLATVKAPHQRTLAYFTSVMLRELNKELKFI
jgi:hypothetical protein